MENIFGFHSGVVSNVAFNDNADRLPINNIYELRPGKDDKFQPYAIFDGRRPEGEVHIYNSHS